VDTPPPSSPFSSRLFRPSVALTGLFVLALFFALHEGRAFFLPVVLVLLLHFLLGPSPGRSKRRGFRSPRARP